jgi:hypothetical protein
MKRGPCVTLLALRAARRVQFAAGAILQHYATPPWGGFDFADRCQSWVSVPKARPATLRVAMRAGTTGLSLGF